MGEAGADCSLMLNKGLNFINQATAADAEGRTREAIRLYSLGLESLLSVLKFERNERIVNTLRARVREYMARAEQLKASLSQPDLHASSLSASPSLSLPSPPASMPTSPPPVKAMPPQPIHANPIVHSPPPPPAASKTSSLSHTTPPPPPTIKGPARIELREGQTGCSYAAVLGPHLQGATDLTLCYPNLHSEYHVRNLLSLYVSYKDPLTLHLILMCTPPQS